MDEYNWYNENTSQTPPQAEAEAAAPSAKHGAPAWLIALAITLPVCILTMITCFVFVLSSGIAKQAKSARSSGQDGSAGITVSPSPIDGGRAESALNAVVNIKNSGEYNGFFGQSLSFGEGSGIIINSDGYILTSASVVENEGSIKVTLQNKDSYDATVVKVDSSNNAALLKIEASGLSYAAVGDSSAAALGDSVAVVGNPLNENISNPVTAGTICGIDNNVRLQNGQSVNIFQIDASAVSGSVGAPIFNQSGELIAITTAMISNNSSEIGLATPINDLSELIGSVATVNGQAPSGLTIGISGSDEGYGVIIEMVEEGSPAEKGGLKVGDLIVKADGEAVTSVSEITNIKNRHKSGDTMTLTIYRDGEMKDIAIVFE